jgi:hypothetical protein
MLPDKLLPSSVCSIKELDEFRKIAIKNIQAAQLKFKERYDAKNTPVMYPVNSLVLLKIPKYKPGISKKLAAKYVGPYKVEAQLSPVIYRVSDLQNPTKPWRTIHVRLIRPYYLRPNTQFSVLTREPRREPKPHCSKTIPPQGLSSDDSASDSDDSDSDYEAQRTQYVTRSGRITRKPDKYSK